MAGPWEKYQGAPSGDGPWSKYGEPKSDSPAPGFVDSAIQGVKNVGAGAIRGAGSIGATLLAPVDMASDALAGKGLSLESNRQRRADMDAALQTMGADTDSLAFKGGKLAGEIAGTAGAGGVVANGMRIAAPAVTRVAPAAGNALQRIATATQSAGMTTGAAPATTFGQGAANLATRATGGAISGAAQAGLANPEDAGIGALIGGALPVVSKVAGSAGDAVGRTFRGPQVPPSVTDAAKQAIEAGYVIPPTQAKPTLTNRLLEGFSGKLTTAQNASTKNQPITNELARKAIGASELTPEGIAAVRTQANKAYDELGQVGAIQADDVFRSAMDKIGSTSKQLKADFPELVNKDIDSLVTQFGEKEKFDAQSAIEAMKRLRASGSTNKANFTDPEKKALGQAQMKMAEALENLVDRNLQSSGRTELLANFREARQTLAKAYDVEKALNPSTGNVDANKLAQLLKKGRPLSGELKTAADFASNFKTAAKMPENMGSLPQTSPLDWAMALGAAFGTQNPLALATVAARPAARYATLSPMIQRGLANKPNRLLELSQFSRDALTAPVYRSAPLLGSSQ